MPTVDQHRPRVFICYAHEDDAHRRAVHRLAEFLVANGIGDVHIDIWVDTEPRDWGLWAREQIEAADYVIVVASPRVERIGNETAGTDDVHGLRTELNLLRQRYHRHPDVWPRRILQVVLPGGTPDNLPDFLVPHLTDYYRIDAFTVAGAEGLLRVLLNRPAHVRPEPGPVPQLPSKPISEITGHWLLSARGTDQSATEFWFTGRHRALASIGAFCREVRPGLLVVTGMPGAGKSALLGVVVLRSLAPDALPHELRATVPDCRIRVAVHAQGKTGDAVLTEVLQALGSPVPDGVDVRDHLMAASLPPDAVCVVDALDEATDPSGVAEAVRRLSGRARVVVGVRPDGPAAAGGSVLVPAKLQTVHPEVVDLDADDHLGSGDVARYVAQRLRADRSRAGGYGTDAWDLDVLVDVLGFEIDTAVALGNFLVAQLVVEELLHAPVLPDRRAGWSRRLHWPRELDDWVDRDLRRRLAERAPRARATLSPVAHAQRGGLDTGRWVTLAPRFGVEGNADAAVAEVQRDLGFYLAVVGPGRYALRHRQFADHFRGQLPPGRGDNLFVDTLLDGVPRTEDGRRSWGRADDYTGWNLLVHAREADRLAEVVGDHPACLARIDPLSAGALLAAATEPVCRIAADVLRRASYAASDVFGERAAAMQAHAVVAGHDELADALLRDAGPELPWHVGWWVGTVRRGVVPLGETERTQAVVPVEVDDDGLATVVLSYPDGRCVVRDPASGQALGPELTLPRPVDRPPVLRAWQSPEGVIYLAVGESGGEVTVRALTGPAAGAVRWSGSVDGPLCDLARVRGPRGTDLIVTLAGEPRRPLVRPFRPDVDAGGALVDAPSTADRILPLRPTAVAAGFLVAGADSPLSAWRLLPASAPASIVVPDDALRTSSIVAVGDADHAHVVGTTAEGITLRQVSLDGSGLGPAVRLSDGGRTTRCAIGGDGLAATVAVADGNGVVDVFDVDSGAVTATVTVGDLGEPVYDLAFLDRTRSRLAVASWSGRVTVLTGAEPVATGFHHGEAAVRLVPLGETDDGTLVVARGRSGLTRLWQLTATGSDDSPPPIDRLATAPTGSGQVLVLAAASGDTRVTRWMVDLESRDVRPAPDLRAAEPVAALASLRREDGIRVAAAGANGVALWRLDSDGDSAAESQVAADQPDVEYVAFAADPDGQIVLVTAGPESARIWVLVEDDPALVETLDEEWITAFAVNSIGADRTAVVLGSDEGIVRLVDPRESPPRSRVVHTGERVAAVAAVGSDDRLRVADSDHYGTTTLSDAAAPENDRLIVETGPYQLDRLVAGSDGTHTRLLGVSATPARALLWAGDDLQLIGTPDLRGAPLHATADGLVFAVADGGGQVLLITAVGEPVPVRLNLPVDALAPLPDGALVSYGGGLLALYPGGPA